MGFISLFLLSFPPSPPPTPNATHLHIHAGFLICLINKTVNTMRPNSLYSIKERGEGRKAEEEGEREKGKAWVRKKERGGRRSKRERETEKV